MRPDRTLSKSSGRRTDKEFQPGRRYHRHLLIQRVRVQGRIAASEAAARGAPGARWFGATLKTHRLRLAFSVLKARLRTRTRLFRGPAFLWYLIVLRAAIPPEAKYTKSCLVSHNDQCSYVLCYFTCYLLTTTRVLLTRGSQRLKSPLLGVFAVAVKVLSGSQRCETFNSCSTSDAIQVQKMSLAIF